MKRIWCAVCVVLIGCSSMLPVVMDDDVRRAQERWPGVTRASLEEGRQKYIDRCGGCHSLHLPSAFTESEWQRAVESMQVRAKVGSDEKELILRYLTLGKGR